MSQAPKPPHALKALFEASRKSLGQVGLFSLFINLMMLVPPLYMLQIYDRVLTSRSEETLLLLTLLLGWMFATLGVLEFVRSRMMVRIGARLDEHLKERLYHLVMKLGLSQQKTGAQPLADLANIRQFVSGNGVFAFFDTPWAPVYLAILFLFDTAMGLLGLFAMLLLGTLAIVNEFSTRKLQSQAAGDHQHAAQTLESQLRNAEAAQAMGMQQALCERWNRAHAASLQAQTEAADRTGLWSSLSKTLRLLLQSLMLGLGAYLAISKQITPGMVIAGSIILGRALAPIDQMINAWKGFTGARLSYQRLNDLLEEQPQAERRVSLPAPEGRLQIERAVVMPPGGETPALRGVSLEVAPGEALAIIGSSAAGKSTLVRALLGLWPLSHGSVRLDGADIGHWNRDELGPHIGYLPQDVELFDGTVAQNIARFSKAKDRKVIKAAQIAGVDELIRALPEGYDTRIGPGGLALSGGQRQRIGLARAVFGDPRLVVLDEPNAHLDMAGEKALSATCRYLRKQGVTLVLVSHRHNILRHVDRVLLLDRGQQQLLGPRDAVLQHLQDKTRPMPVPAARNPNIHLAAGQAAS